MSTITNFYVRGCYQRKRDLVAGWQSRQEQKKQPRSPAYLPPIVVFEAPGGKGLITVRDFDVPLLHHVDAAEKTSYLNLIIEARRLGRTDSEPAQLLKTKLAAYYSPRQETFADLRLTESKFVVPCTSTGAYEKTAVSDKGATLLLLAQQGYPVPDFSIVTASNYELAATEKTTNILQSIANLEKLSGQELGGTERPLVFAVRCAMPQYIPGLMPTYLNVGVTRNNLSALARRYGLPAAYIIYLTNLRNMLMTLDFIGTQDLRSQFHPHSSLAQMQALALKFEREIAGRQPALLTDAKYQALYFCWQAYKMFADNRDVLLTFSRGEPHFPALILQKMACSVRDERSHAGVWLSRNSQTGLGMELATVSKANGDEIMTGTLPATSTFFVEPGTIKDSFPGVAHFTPLIADLQALMQAPVTLEFADDNGFFALLQLNRAELTGRATCVAVMELFRAGVISAQRVAELIKPYHERQLTSPAISASSLAGLELFCQGASILPRTAVTGQAALTKEAALELTQAGATVVLFKEQFIPEDTLAMNQVDAVCGLSPGAIHVVTTCQGLGIPALFGLAQYGVTMDRSSLTLRNKAGRKILPGDWVTISSKRRALFLGKAEYVEPKFLAYLEGKEVDLTEEEKQFFPLLAKAYKEYKALMASLANNQGVALADLQRIISYDLRQSSKTEKAAVVQKWVFANEAQYIAAVLASNLGDHHDQAQVFGLLTAEQQIGFFKRAIALCLREGKFGFQAGSFMIGRFITLLDKTVAFWGSFTAQEIVLLMNEWLLFEKYREILTRVGEQKINRARQEILTTGLGSLTLIPGRIKDFMGLKLSPSIKLSELQSALPATVDSQVAELMAMLQLPYSVFFDFSTPWGISSLKTLCDQAGLPLPRPEDV